MWVAKSLLKALLCRKNLLLSRYYYFITIIESVLNFSKPKSLTALRSFLGLANYFRSFVPFHSDIVKPLQQMIDPKGKKSFR